MINLFAFFLLSVVSEYDNVVFLVSSDMACVNLFGPCILRHRILF